MCLRSCLAWGYASENSPKNLTAGVLVVAEKQHRGQCVAAFTMLSDGEHGAVLPKYA